MVRLAALAPRTCHPTRINDLALLPRVAPPPVLLRHEAHATQLAAATRRHLVAGGVRRAVAGAAVDDVRDAVELQELVGGGLPISHE